MAEIQTWVLWPWRQLQYKHTYIWKPQTHYLERILPCNHTSTPDIIFIKNHCDPFACIHISHDIGNNNALHTLGERKYFQITEETSTI